MARQARWGESSSRFYTECLADLPPQNLVVQPKSRGTVAAFATVLSLATIGRLVAPSVGPAAPSPLAASLARA